MTTLSASLAELGQCGLLKSADLIALDPFLRESPIESLAAGNVLIRAGQPNHQLYLVLSGRLRVHLSAGDATPFATVEAGETVGEVSLLDHQPASATVVADTESRVVVIDEEVLWTLIEHSHAVACNMLAALARRLRYGNVVLRRAEENSAYLATHDALTDLPNRALFEDRLTQALVHSRRASGLAAVLVFDLDRFKRVNSGLGHIVGDRLLRETAKRLQEQVRAGDTVARLGGDEFVIVLCDLARPEEAAHHAHRFLEAARHPLHIAAQNLVTTASIGIALFPRDGEDIHALLRNADTAMYHAKELGGSNFQFYAWEMNAASLERLEMESRLHQALAGNEFHIHYQPRVGLETGRIVGVEALLRWQHPHLGTVSPMTFIPILEESGLIVDAGEWALHCACAQGRKWLDAGIAPGRVAVNLSARQFQQEDLAQRIAAMLAATGLEANRLEIEITESMVAQNADRAVCLLRQIKDLGVSLSIDDFGTGYSSLAQLKRYPVDSLKIDRSFIRDLPEDPDGMAITRAVIALAHSLKLKVVAEGVETEAQRDFLIEHGCEEAQGYLFSRPVPAAELEEPLARGTAP